MIRKIITILCLALLATVQLSAQSTHYSATFETTGSGHVSLNKWSTITAGETLRLFLRPSEDWELQSVKVVLQGNESTELELTSIYDPNYTAYSFEAPESNIIVRATFIHVLFSVTIDQPDNGGLIEASTDKARQGETVTITSYPDIDHTTAWVHVNRDDNSQDVTTTKQNDNQYTYEMPNSDVIVTVGFNDKPQYNITLQAGQNGVSTVNSSGVQDEFITITATPNKGYVVERVWASKIENIDGGIQTSPLNVSHVEGDIYSFVMPAAQVTVHTLFKKRIYPVIIVSGADKAEFVLNTSELGFEGGSTAGIFIHPNQPDHKITKLVINDDEGNELDYSIDYREGSSAPYYFLHFTMPYSSVELHATIKPPHDCPIDINSEGPGQVVANVETARPGETVTITVTPDNDCTIKSLSAVVGYEVSNGNGGAHAPSRAASLWYDQQVLELTKVDDSHYQFTLPEVLASELTPNYLDATRVKVTAELVYVGPQAIYCADNTTLYFVYDTPAIYRAVGDKYEGHTITGIWNGNDVTSVGWGTPGWSGYHSNVTSVVFTEGFAAARPTSCNKWFFQFTALNTIEGIENLNTSEVTNMNSMFMACSSVSTLDLNSFDTRKVTNTSTMFRACSSLTTIYCDSTWNIDTSVSMFTGCTRLVGAVTFNNNVGAEMANPHTGYFTGRWPVKLSNETNVHYEGPDFAYTNVTVNIILNHFFSTITAVTVTGDRTGENVSVTTGEGGAYSFVMPAEPVTITLVLSNPEGDIAAALWCEDNTTLYFVNQPLENFENGTWDGHAITRAWSNDKVIDVKWSTPGWNDIKGMATTVVFDESFASARPLSCNRWFMDFETLSTIEGLENLNTSEVTNMNSMFYTCRSITTLNLNGFDMRKVSNVSSMFRNCDLLTTIYCDSTWNVSTTTGMFHRCSKLVGAATYDALKVDGNMANPRTGYFTGKWNINIPSRFDHGTVTCEKTTAYTNETVTLTVTPDNKYKLKSLTITMVDETTSDAPRRAQGGTIDYTQGDGTVTFVMPPAPVSVNATFVKNVSTAIDEIDATQQSNGQRYDLQGRPVGRDYRGIVIENGTKRVVK